MTIDDIMALAENYQRESNAYAQPDRVKVVKQALRTAIQAALDEARADERERWTSLCKWFEELPDADMDSQEEARFKAGQRYSVRCILDAIRKGPTP